jgi:cystathionine beta-lyase/cystathionine gamma-synthase/S-methylmethionine-dependent homocysteine/selenocysteine methylase
MRFDTRLVQVGQEPDQGTGDVVPAIHVATTYERRVQDTLRYFYARGENPTREALERCLASLEDARFAMVFPSGQSAAATVLTLLDPGQRLISSDDVYGGTYNLFRTLSRYDIEVDYVDLTDIAALDAALRYDVGMIWIETPTNPLLKITDLVAVHDRVRENRIRIVVDNTLAGPALQQPLRFGADVTLYSTTKGIAGHSDVLGGALVYDDEELHHVFSSHRASVGSVPGPLDCFLVHRGLKTLSLRTSRQVSNASRIAAELRGVARVGALNYPGFADHPQYQVGIRQMSAPGSILSFEYLDDPARLFKRLKIFTYAVSLGGVRSLIEHPATMTHSPIPLATRVKLGISDNLIRVSAGIEDPEDLLEDLLAALLDAAKRDAMTNLPAVQDLVWLDGGVATELQRAGLPVRAPWWTTWALNGEPNRRILREIHERYIMAGAQVITANTFRCNLRALGSLGLDRAGLAWMVHAAVGVARAAREAAGSRLRAQVAGSMAPVADCYRPGMVPPDDELRIEHGWLAKELVRSGADFVLIETMNSSREARIALEQVHAAGARAWVSFVCAPHGRLLSGEELADAARAVERDGAQSVLVNCTTMDVTETALRVLQDVCSVPFGAYPNIEGRSGIPDNEHVDHYVSPNVGSAEFSDRLAAWRQEFPISILGGCCGTTPEHLAAARDRLVVESAR